MKKNLFWICLVWLLVVSALTYRNLFAQFFEKLPGLVHKSWEKSK